MHVIRKKISKMVKTIKNEFIEHVPKIRNCEKFQN